MNKSLSSLGLIQTIIGILAITLVKRKREYNVIY